MTPRKRADMILTHFYVVEFIKQNHTDFFIPEIAAKFGLPKLAIKIIYEVLNIPELQKRIVIDVKPERHKPSYSNSTPYGIANQYR